MTDKEAKKFYNSTMWKHKRMQILERDHYECQDCRKRLRDAVAAGDILRGEEKKIRRAEEVHHIVELKEHPELGLEICRRTSEVDKQEKKIAHRKHREADIKAGRCFF